MWGGPARRVLTLSKDFQECCESSMLLPFFFFCLSPKYFKMVPGEGMPLPEDPTKKGDLFIFFDIQFPTRLTPQKKQMLRQALLT